MYVFALLFVGQTHWSAPTVLVFFVVFVGANRCVRPFLRGAVFRWADTSVCPYGAGVFSRCCRGEPVCSPCYCIAWCFVGQTHRSAPTVLVFFVVVVGANRRVRPFLRGAVFAGQTRRSAATGAGAFCRCCRGEPACSPLLLHCCCFLSGRHIGLPLRCWCFLSLL